jgi:hypothetical protein
VPVRNMREAYAARDRFEPVIDVYCKNPHQ